MAILRKAYYDIEDPDNEWTCEVLINKFLLPLDKDSFHFFMGVLDDDYLAKKQIFNKDFYYILNENSENSQNSQYELEYNYDCNINIDFSSDSSNCEVVIEIKEDEHPEEEADEIDDSILDDEAKKKKFWKEEVIMKTKRIINMFIYT